MALYRVTAPNGKEYEIEGPAGASNALVVQALLAQYPDAAKKPPEPAAVSKIKGLFPTPVADVLHQVADVPIGLQKGVMQGIRMVSDMFGANNAFSQSVKQNETALANLMSAQAKNDQQEIARILKEAEDKGVLDQIKAGVKAFTVAPVDTLTSALGTAAPAIVAALGAKVLGAGALLTTGISMATGAGMGAGTIKGTIYEETKKALEEAGVPGPVAEERAMKAQEYGGQNLDQILAGAAIGGVAARGPLEKGAVRAIASRISKNVAAREAAESVSEKVAKGAATGRIRAGVAEALPETGQAAQEQIAANIAQQREGLDTPTFRGAAAAGTMEGLGGGVLGATFGGGREPTAAPVATPGAPGAPALIDVAVAQQPAPPPVPAPAPELPTPPTEAPVAPPVVEETPVPPVAETPAPPPIEEPKVRKPGEPPVGGLQPAEIEELGISKKQPIYRRMLGKDLENPEQRAEVLEDIENYLTKGLGSEESRAKLTEFKAKFAPAEAVTPAPPAATTPAGTAVTFETAKGSQYSVFDDGTTQRNKAPRPEHPGDQGIKERTARTIYVDGDASRLSAAGVENIKGARVIIDDDGTASLVWENPITGKLGASPSSAKIKFYTEPAVGRSPLELWGPTDVFGREGYSGMHAGNKITKISPAPVAPPVAETPSVPSVPTEPEAGRAGAPVVIEPSAGAAPEGVGAPEPTGVVRPVADVEQPAGGERAAPAAVTPAAPAPTVEAPAAPKEKVLKGSVENQVKALNVNAAQGGVPDLKVVREVLEPLDPKMFQAVSYYLGVDSDGNLLVGANNMPQTPSAQEAAQMAGLGENSGDRVKKVAKALGIDGKIVRKFQASQNKEFAIGRSKTASESGTGARLESQESGLITDQEWYKPIAAKGLKGANHTELARAALLSERFLENEANIPVFQGLMTEAQARARRPEFKSAVRSQQEMLAPDITGISRGKEAEAALLEEPTYEEDIAPGQEESVEEGREEGGEDVEYRTIPQSPVVTNRASHAELEKVVAEIEKALGGKVDVTILDDVTDVDAKQKPGSRAGATIKGGIYLFRSGIAKGIEGQKTIFHELFHKGLKNLLPEAEYRATMNKFYSQSVEIRAMADAYLASDVGKGDTKNLSPQDARVLAVEESLAEVAEQTDLKPTLVRQVGNFLARVADRFGMPQLARAIRTMGLNEQEKFIRDALQAGVGPSKAGEGATRFRPGTSAFKRWFGDSKVVDEKGEPLVVYHGTDKSFTAFNASYAGSNTANRTANWGFFFSNNPKVAEIFAGRSESLKRKPEWVSTQPEGLDKIRVAFGLRPKNVRRVLTREAEFEDKFPSGANLVPAFLSIQNAKEIPAEEFIERFASGREDPKGFITQAKQDGYDGVVIRAGKSRNYTWQRTEYESDAWVAFEPTQIKSATGNVGAYGQRPVTKEEAERFGMTEAEAAKAQAAGDVRFRSITPQTEAAVQGVDVIGEQEAAKPMSGNPALKARINLANNMGGLMDAFTKWYGGDIRTAMGRLNPITLISRALDSDRISAEAQLIGGLKKLDGLIVATELTDANGDPMLGADGKPLSYKNVVARIADAAKKAKKPFAEYLKSVDTALYGHREYNVRKNNELLEQQAQALEAAGKKPEADKLREEIATLAIKDPKKLDALEAAFQQDDFIKGISADLDAIRFNFIDMLVDTGRISKEAAQEWKDNEGYIPFKRVQDYTDAFDDAGSSRRGVGATRNIKKFKGSTRQSTSVVENFSSLLNWATGEAMRNEARNRALEDMVIMGAAKRGSAPAPDSPGGVQQTYENGERKEYYVPDPMLMVGFGMQPYEMGRLTKALNKYGTRVLRAGVTTMPPFAIKQVFDDISRAYAYAGVKNNAALTKNILFNFPKNWANEIFKTELFKTTKGQVNVKDLRKLGIVATFDLSREGNIKDVMVEAGAKKEGLFNTILRVMEAGAKASDLSVRQAIYSQVLKETGDTAKAESAAREIINFSYQGAMKEVRFVASVVPFFNAYAQGMDKLATAAAGKVVGQTTGVARSMFYTRMTYLTAMGLAYALMMQDDEEYNKLEDHVRDTHWILPGVKINGKPVGIPLAPDLGFFFKAIPERVVRYLKYQGTDEERAAIEVASELFVRGYDVFSPPNVTPQLIRPVLENLVNYSFFLGRPLESQAQLQRRPFERYGVGTSDAMKVVAEWLESSANATGIDAFAVSPIKLENAVRGLLGTTGGIALSIADMMINPDRTDRPLHQQLSAQLTGASAVLKNPVGTKYMDEIYNLEKKSEQVYNTYKNQLKTDPDKADKFLEDNIGMYEIRPAVQAVMKQIRALNKIAMDIDKDTSMSPEERRKEIDELRVEQNEIARVVFSLRKEARDIQMGL